MKNIQSYLNNQSLGNVFSKAKILAKANTHLQSTLPPALQPHCQIANFTASYITIATDSATYLTQLKCLQVVLLQSLQQLPPFQTISTVHFIIIPSLCEPPTPTAQVPVISDLAKDLVQTTAARIQNTRLKQALEHLAHVDENH